MSTPFTIWRAAVPRRKPALCKILRRCWPLVLAAPILPAMDGAIDDVPPESSYHLRTWFTDDGLPHNTVNRILQDGRGYVWLATPGGLARFDGRDFREFELPAEFRTNGYNIRGFAREKDDRLVLLPTSGDVVRLDESGVTVHPVTDALAGRRPAEVFIAADQSLWLGLAETGVVRWTPHGTMFFDLDGALFGRASRFSFATDERGDTWVAARNTIAHFRSGRLVPYPQKLADNVLIASSRGGIWICASNGIWRLEQGHLRLMCGDVPWSGGLEPVRHLFEDSQGTLWIAASRLGLHRFAGDRLVRVATPYPGITFVTEDRERGLWIAAGGNGLGLLRRKRFALVDVSAGLSDNVSTAICEDGAGNVWLAHRTDGLVRISDGVSQIFPLLEAGGRSLLNTLGLDAAGRIWMGGRAGLYRADANDPGSFVRLPQPWERLHIIYPTRTGDLWFSSDDGSVGFYRNDVAHVFSAADGYAGQLVRAIAEDQMGQIWIGAQNGDLLRYDGSRFTRYTAADGLPGQPINAIHVDHAGVLWIATAGGLVVSHGGGFRRLGRAEGLADELIGQILEDDDGYLWFMARQGLFYAAKEELREVAAGIRSHVHPYAFGREQGLSGISPLFNYQPAACKTRDGRLWFATSKGVVVLQPKEARHDLPPAPVYVDDVRIDGISYPTRGDLRIPPGRHRIEFHFTVPSFSAPENVRLRHQLLGADPDWVMTDRSRSASYAGLPPGTYHLRVRTGNGAGDWSEPEEAILTVTLLAAWWQNRWLQAGGLVASVSLMALGIHRWTRRRLQRRLWRLEQENMLERERARIARDLHDDLGGSLTEIGLLADRLRDASAGELPEALGRLAWRTRRLGTELASIVWTVSPKNNSLDLLAVFLRRYAMRFFRGTGIDCVVKGVDNVPPRPLMPEVQHHILAVAKEALNNAMKHAQARRVTLRVALVEDVFELAIEDDGIGFQPESASDPACNGLHNMRSRSGEIGGEVQVHSEPHQGTRVVLRVPGFRLSESTRVRPAGLPPP